MQHCFLISVPLDLYIMGHSYMYFYKIIKLLGIFERLVTTNNKASHSKFNLTAGRLEVFFSGKWGSICSDGFSMSDAKVFCVALTGSSNATVLRYGSVGSDGLG